MEGGTQVILGPVPCQGCRQPVVWNGKRWKNPRQARGGHVCRGVCGSLMPVARERCGRKAGHNGYHRSRYAMDNECAAKSGRRAA